MKRLDIVTLALAACGGATAPVHNAVSDAPPAVRFAVVRGDTVTIQHTTATGVATERTIKLPDTVYQLVWNGGVMAVRLRLPDDPMSLAVPDFVPTPVTGHEGEMGRITDAGYVAFPDIAWPNTDAPKDPGNNTRFDPPRWGLSVTSAGEIFQDRCDWGIVNDGGACIETRVARRYPEPVVFGASAHDLAKPGPTRVLYTLPQVPPPREPAVSLAKGPDRRWGRTDAQVDVVRCVSDRGATQYPPAPLSERSSFRAMERIAWLSTTPPIYTADELSDGYIGSLDTVVFEGCAKSARFYEVIPGPHEMFALNGNKLSLRWHGRELALLDGAHQIVFEPTVAPAPN